MLDLKAFYQPRTVAEAVTLLEEHGDRARPLAGGTAMSISRTARVEALVDLGRLQLDTIADTPDGLRLGAMVTCAKLLAHLRTATPTALGEAAAGVGSRVLQNHVTVGGNCVMVYAWSDLPVALWCLDARFVVQGRARRELGADRLFAEHPTHVLGAGELLTQIVVPPPPPQSGSTYVKYARNATDQGLASVAAQVTLAAGVVSAARLTVGAVRGLPQILNAALRGLQGQAPAPAAIAAAARVAADEAKVTADYRASAEYRRELLVVLIEDALSLAARRAGGAA